MNDSSRNARRRRAEPATGYLYYWLLAALFLEYARPASFFTFLNIPFVYSAFPFLLFGASLFAPGLRPMAQITADRVTRWVFALLAVVFLSMVTHGSYAIEKFNAVFGYVIFFVLIARIATTRSVYAASSRC